VDADRVERVLFGLVAGRALAPSSKLEACSNADWTWRAQWAVPMAIFATSLP
jgi:hypothetical protein